MDDFLANEAKGTKVIGAHSLEEMVSKLKKPRRIILLVKAGSAVDDFINKLVRQMFFLTVTSLSLGEVSSERSQLFVSTESLSPDKTLIYFLQVPLLETGDIIIDGGNSEYRDTTVSLFLTQNGWIKYTSCDSFSSDHENS